jgi:translation initiation factor eIF-2B subunit delta
MGRGPDEPFDTPRQEQVARPPQQRPRQPKGEKPAADDSGTTPSDDSAPAQSARQPKKQPADKSSPDDAPRQPRARAAKQPPPDKAGPQPQQQKQTQVKPSAEAAAEEPRPPPRPVSVIGSLFSHIPVVHRMGSKELLGDMKKPSDRPLVHPALLEFALQAAQDFSLDEDERTRVFLRMMSRQITDEPEDDRDLFANLIKRTMDFLYPSKKRLTPVGIGNAVRSLKSQNAPVDQQRDREAARVRRDRLLSSIDHFIEDKIDDVASFLTRTVGETILENDVVLTYGWSPIILNALTLAGERVSFRVIVVDSRPNFDSKRLIQRIPQLDVRYVLLTGLSYCMPEVTKVLIEPNGILSNNAAQTPIGTAMIAMVAHEYGVPVIFACPSYRFVSKVSIGAVSHNEILSGELIASVAKPGVVTDNLEYLALTYDVTPGQYVDIVMCEFGSIPVNSISTNMKFIQDSYSPFGTGPD